MNKLFTINDRKVNIQDCLTVSTQHKKLKLSNSKKWREKIIRSREILVNAGKKGKIIYGFNTGVGNSSKIILSQVAEAQLQNFLLAQHGVGVGADLSEYESRAVTFTRLVSLSKGYSAVRFELLEAFLKFINAGIVPAIPAFGSVGASGDLTPLSYVGAALTGKRYVYFQGEKMPSIDALRKNNIEPFSLASKEGIAILNGTAVMTSVGILTWYRAKNCLNLAMKASALTTEVLKGDPMAFDPIIHQQKPFPGQIHSAKNILSALQGSKLLRWQGETRNSGAKKTNRTVQDRYSVRCSPHVIGAGWDALTWIKEILTTELNSVNDNPMVDPEGSGIYMGGNFYGGHVALGMDLMKIAMASVMDLLDRQFALLVDEDNNRGLPENLLPPLDVTDPEFGIYHGLKGLQITMSALTARAIQKAQSDTLLSRPTEAGNQDKVSMGTNAAYNARDIVEILEQGLGILFIALSQAAYIRNEGNISPAARKLLRWIRTYVPPITRDKALDIQLKNLFLSIKEQAFHIDNDE